jgi:hypothetical protein
MRRSAQGRARWDQTGSERQPGRGIADGRQIGIHEEAAEERHDGRRHVDRDS